MPTRYRAYKTKLRVNDKESSHLFGCAGLARFAFNWGLAAWQKEYEAGGKPNAWAITKQFNAIKGEEFPWVTEYPNDITKAAFNHLGRAFQNFFRRVRQGETPGYPKFKSRHRTTPSFTVSQSIHVEEGRIKLPRIGWLRLAEKGYLPTSGVKILSANISHRGGDWYVALQVQEEVAEPTPPTGPPIGIDLGVKSLAVVSDGTVFDNPRTLAHYEKRLARLQREYSRRQKGSSNREKTRQKIAALHRKIADTRSHTLHDISRYVTVTTKPATIVLENLDVKSMLQTSYLAKNVSDAALGELKRQIAYKAEWAGIRVVEAEQEFPSSKTCSNCGHVVDSLSLSKRVFACPGCGVRLDRDLNAALNLVTLAG